MSQAIVLGDFLRRRRHAFDHASTDMPSYGQRRVPGLRREELALLAGISTSYYTRIEQGAAGGVSASVLDALARALRLDDEERAHLYRLARVLPPSTAAGGAAGIHPTVELFLSNAGWLPAGVLGLDMAVLGWNRSCHQVFADHLPFELPSTGPAPNWAHLLFTDPVTRSRFADWERHALDITGRLRTSQALHPTHPGLNAAVDRLEATSDEFRRMWAEHPTRDAPLGDVVLHHPRLGDLELTDLTLRPTEHSDQLVIVFQPEPGSTTELALRALAAR